MFWKRFKQAHDAGRYFSQANACWLEAKQYVLEGKQKSANESLVEVIRFCQQAIESDERTGDAYILLANALMNLANQMSEQAEAIELELLLQPWAAVIHFWHSLPYRSHPISKNAIIGEQLWRTAVHELKGNRSLSESDALSLLDAYRDNLAAEITSPESFERIKGIILNNAPALETEHRWLRDTLEEALSPETRHFITKILPEVMQRRTDTERVSTDRLGLRELTDSLQYENRIYIADVEIMERIQKSYHNSNSREVVGWITWLYLLLELRHHVMLDSDIKEDAITEQSKICLELLQTACSKARQEADWDALLLAVGLCEWRDLPRWRDELMGVIYDHIDKQAVAARLLDIERQPRMLIEDTIVNRLQDYLGSVER